MENDILNPMKKRHLVEADERGVWLNRNLAIFLAILTILSIFAAIVTNVSAARSDINRNTEVLNELRPDVKKNSQEIADVKGDIKSINTKLDYLIKLNGGSTNG